MILESINARGRKTMSSTRLDQQRSEVDFGFHRITWCAVCTSPVVCNCTNPKAPHHCRRHTPKTEEQP